MTFLIITSAFIFGAIIGSFLNVVGIRMNTGRTFVTGRSQCMSCQSELRWYELVPVISYFYQRGRCRTCDSKISFRYPLVEIGTGLLMVMIVGYAPTAIHVVIWAIMYSLLVVITLYDISHKIIPDVLVFPFSLIALASLFMVPGEYWGLALSSPWVWDILAGAVVPLPFFLVWLFSRGRAFGLGDVKLMIGLGWLLGLWGGISAVVLAFWVGTAFVLLYFIAMKLVPVYAQYRGFAFFDTSNIMKTQIPFGPFLVLGAILVQFLDMNIMLRFLM